MDCAGGAATALSHNPAGLMIPTALQKRGRASLATAVHIHSRQGNDNSQFKYVRPGHFQFAIARYSQRFSESVSLTRMPSANGMGTAPRTFGRGLFCRRMVGRASSRAGHCKEITIQKAR